MKTIKELAEWKLCCRGAYEIAKLDMLRLIDEFTFQGEILDVKELKKRING